MKKLIITLFLGLGLAAGLYAQEQEKEMKTGWSLGVLPTATYSVDNGFQAGAFGDVYYYGDGNTYPDPIRILSTRSAGRPPTSPTATVCVSIWPTTPSTSFPTCA